LQEVAVHEVLIIRAEGGGPIDGADAEVAEVTRTVVDVALLGGVPSEEGAAVLALGARGHQLDPHTLEGFQRKPPIDGLRARIGVRVEDAGCLHQPAPARSLAREIAYEIPAQVLVLLAQDKAEARCTEAVVHADRVAAPAPPRQQDATVLAISERAGTDGHQYAGQALQRVDLQPGLLLLLSGLAPRGCGRCAGRGPGGTAARLVVDLLEVGDLVVESHEIELTVEVDVPRVLAGVPYAALGQG